MSHLHKYLYSLIFFIVAPRKKISLTKRGILLILLFYIFFLLFNYLSSLISPIINTRLVNFKVLIREKQDSIPSYTNLFEKTYKFS
ncbi:uncharacterized protein OCT59_013230 [Rhizophagus irregularis]|uniref:uncharacterized protein n=1 Tax=Rhizophagus irregularis TaxID=588596 RepID=UPI00332892F7|nr:hypothetical protein OCT59_013230 [Rhizophagus irregularis]